jgi:hypothetical protein
MKLLSLFLVSAVSIQAFSTSLYYGPWINKTVGNYSCRIKPNAAVIKNKGSTQVVKLNLDYAKLTALITAASQANLVTGGLHIRKTDPAVIFEAGVSPDISPFTFYKDASRIVKKSGSQAEALIKMVNSICK